MLDLTTLTVRPIAAADRPEWERLWRDYLTFYETGLPAATIEAAFARLIDPDSAAHGLIALAGDRPVGLAHFIHHDHLWRPEGVVYLQDLFVDPAARGARVGAALIRAVYAAADAAGRPQVYWLTQDFNHRARRLYDRIGRLSPFIRYDRA